MPEDYLDIRGARVHNLKNFDLRLPHNRLIVVTGVSGSGKSSLVFDLIYAEGRRRYVESLSSYARQFLERMEKPEVDEVLGIAPTVAIRQKNTTRNPRSTVATTTEIADFLRLLYARAGRVHCRECGQRVRRDDIDFVARTVLAQEPRSRWYVLFPVREAPGEERRKGGSPKAAPKARLAELRGRGYNRLFQAGRTFEFSTPESLLDVDFGKDLYVLVDRIAIAPDIRERVVDAVEIAYRECGEARFERADDPSAALQFSDRLECRPCGIEYPTLEPRMFSFNTPFGACGNCGGQGQSMEYAMDAIIGRPYLTLQQGAVTPWRTGFVKYKRRLLKRAAEIGVPTNVPYQELSEEHRRFVEWGNGPFKGIRGFLADLKQMSWQPKYAAMLSRWRRKTVCPDCQGKRYSQEILNVRLGDRSIADVTAMSLAEAAAFFDSLQLEGSEEVIAGNLLTEVQNRLTFLNDVGLQYLTLDRFAATLSGGEAQRIQLASSLGTRLAGVCYVLDEPSIGLHSRDTAKLISVLKELRDLGNTIFVVEHDREMMRAADYLVDLGPAAGERGGDVVFEGSLGQLQARNGSLTARYLSGEAKIDIPRQRRAPRSNHALRFENATQHNLKDLSVEVPLGVLTVITGVSGSGKSTLLHEIIYRSLRNAEYGMELPPGLGAIKDEENVRTTVLVDQSALSLGPRSVPATYMDVFDEIRSLFANTKEARRRGYQAGHFSFNLPSGRCETCAGTGRQQIDMQFLADIDLTCEDCDGKRYAPEVLDVRYRGKNIFEVLQLTADEALRFFEDRPQIVRSLRPLAEVGLGYLRLGQPGSQLSGGEAQRMKLATFIGGAPGSNILFLFDEPTTGLHFEDIRKLLAVFEKLIENGSSVLVVEHNLDVIKCADWILDLGPEGGAGGGRLVVAGPPEEVAACSASHTGRFLREALA